MVGRNIVQSSPATVTIIALVKPKHNTVEEIDMKCGKRFHACFGGNHDVIGDDANVVA